MQSEDSPDKVCSNTAGWLIVVFLLAAALLSRAGVLAASEWQTASPESQGMSGTKLEAIKESLAARKTRAFLVVRNDRIVYEWYAPGQEATKGHYTASMAKAIVGGVSLALAISDGRIALDDRAARFIPQWRNEARKSRITIRQLGSHTSGLADAEAGGLPHNQLTGWEGDFWKRFDPPNDPFTISRDKTPLLFTPGERMQYSNPGIAMLAYAVTASLRDAPQKDIRTLLRDRVMRPIGIADEEWSVGYGKTFVVDGLPLVGPWGGGNYTPRAVARVGQLMLHGGEWEGRQLIRSEAIRLVTSDAGTPGHGGIGWWSNNDGVYEKLPRDACWGSGAGHQVVLVVPSLNLVAVRNGELLAEAGAEPRQHQEPLREYLFQPLVEAVTGHSRGRVSLAPYPPSSAITHLEWAPKETIVRRAEGSDNWPLTWGDDDHLYTAYGDGWGFDPRVPEKLSLGLARIAGGPGDFQGFNLRSTTIEEKGDGAKGKKASGLLMVDGVLYLWARNASNAQLAWSANRGQTWRWSDWKFTSSFGAPTFLNFGRNYAGARDGYVYIYSHDSDSAYERADRMVMARVPKDRIRERAAYEFFRHLGPDHEPVWTKEIGERGGVFEHPGRCYRSAVSFNAALERYLWCQTGPGEDPRFAGGLGIYDAPAPWGPWTTVYYSTTLSKPGNSRVWLQRPSD